MDFLIQTINILADLLVTLILLRVVLSWFVHDRNMLMDFLMNTTDPIINPIRRVMPNFGMLDFSPFVALILINVIRDLLNSMLI